MELLIVLAIIGGAGYYFFKGNTQRGVISVQAYVFLSALNAGMTVEEANKRANYDVAEGPSEVILAARQYVQLHHAGKQLPMIASAKSMGFSQV